MTIGQVQSSQKIPAGDRPRAQESREESDMSADGEGLGPKDSRYIDVESLEWQESGIPGIQRKTLNEDKEPSTQPFSSR